MILGDIYNRKDVLGRRLDQRKYNFIYVEVYLFLSFVLYLMFIIILENIQMQDMNYMVIEVESESRDLL